MTHEASIQTCENPAEQILLFLHRVIPGWKFRSVVAGVGFEPTTFGYEPN